MFIRRFENRTFAEIGYLSSLVNYADLRQVK